MTLAIISHADCASHNMGDSHPESPARLAAIQDQLIASGLDYSVRQYDATPLNTEYLALAHDRDYIEFILKNAPTTGTFELDADTLMTPFSLNAALLSAGAAVDAVDLIMQQKLSSVFCATRPPGHHAERDRAMGFCIFNNVAIGALYAQQKYQLKKIAVLDFDVHHGNGTENILSDKEGFLFCSTYQHPLYPDCAEEKQTENIINSPLPAYTSGDEFREIISRDWLPALHQFKPDMIFISAGFDAHIEDDISQIKLVENDYFWVSEQLRIIADKYGKGRIVSVLEGGYSLHALGRSVVAHIKGLIGN